MNDEIFKRPKLGTNKKYEILFEVVSESFLHVCFSDCHKSA